jgi:hypothetical protein
LRTNKIKIDLRIFRKFSKPFALLPRAFASALVLSSLLQNLFCPLKVAKKQEGQSSIESLIFFVEMSHLSFRSSKLEIRSGKLTRSRDGSFALAKWDNTKFRPYQTDSNTDPRPFERRESRENKGIPSYCYVGKRWVGKTTATANIGMSIADLAIKLLLLTRILV